LAIAADEIFLLFSLHKCVRHSGNCSDFGHKHGSFEPHVVETFINGTTVLVTYIAVARVFTQFTAIRVTSPHPPMVKRVVSSRFKV
jgi:hypothetical protein